MIRQKTPQGDVVVNAERQYYNKQGVARGLNIPVGSPPTFLALYNGDLTDQGATVQTFTRTSNAWNPETGALVSSGTPRYVTGKSGQAIMVEEGSTNLLLQSNGFATTWTASNVATPTQDQTDCYGNANTAWTLTATADNGTLLQTVTSASATRDFSIYIKRLVGSGAISLTVDNGSTWTVKTITSGWVRYDITQAAVTNPVVGVKFATNTDSIAICYSMLESKAYPTSHIPTTTASVTRNAETLTFNPQGLIDVSGNMLLQSNGVGAVSPWNVSPRGTMVTGQADPFGGTEARLCTCTSNGSGFYSYQTGIVCLSPTITASVYAKAGNNGIVGIEIADGTIDVLQTFNVSTGVVGTPQVFSGTPTAVGSMSYIGDGWYRCSVRVTRSSSGNISTYIYGTINSISTYSCTAGQTNYLFGVQLEAMPTASTYQPTTTASISNSKGTIAGWVYTQGTWLGTTNTEWLFGHYTAATNKNLIGLRKAANKIQALTHNSTGGASPTAAEVTQTLTAGWHHLAMTWDVTSLILYVDGIAVNTASTPQLPSVINTTAYVGADYAGTSATQLDTYADSFSIFNRALTAGEIAYMAANS